MKTLGSFEISQVNRFLAQRQHPLPGVKATDPVQATRNIVALHATGGGSYLSLWAPVGGFQRQALEEALYVRRDLVRLLCMRTTLHLVPSDQMPLFHQAYLEQRGPIELTAARQLLVQARLCEEGEAAVFLKDLHHQILDVLTEKGPSTVRQISAAVPWLQAKVQYNVDKPYGGEFSVGSRLVPGMCALGLLVRARPRSTWRSNLYDYAVLAEWLPGLDLETVTPQEARTWLVGRYLSALGPATFDDVQWWTGFSKRTAEEFLIQLRSELAEVSVEGLDGEYMMPVKEAQRLRRFDPAGEPNALFLPSLDPYIMGCKDRHRFLAAEHYDKIFDRASNAMPTVWADGRVVGAWVQRQDGRVVYSLFEPVQGDALAMLEARRLELQSSLGGERIPHRTYTAFTQDPERLH